MQEKNARSAMNTLRRPNLSLSQPAAGAPKNMPKSAALPIEPAWVALSAQGLYASNAGTAAPYTTTS